MTDDGLPHGLAGAWANLAENRAIAEHECQAGHVKIPTSAPTGTMSALSPGAAYDEADVWVEGHGWKAHTQTFAWNGRNAWVLAHWCPSCAALVVTV